MKYDYLIVGAGLFGAVFAYEATKLGKRCLVIDKRIHAGGNIYCEKVEGIAVHKYGAHIFHTNNEEVWRYVNQFTKFNNYINAPVANYKGKLYNLPFNMNTFYQLWGVITPKEAQEKIKEQVQKSGITEPKNLEEQAIFLVGKDIYETLIKGYTQKQWGTHPKDLPAFIIKRLPVRFTYDNNYFNDRYQGIPEGGYNTLIDGLLEGIEVKLGIDFFEEREQWFERAGKVVFTGMIDAFYDYQYGALGYRSLAFEEEILDESNYQGNAVINYTEEAISYTRIIEHKHFEKYVSEKTVITKEYPKRWEKGEEPYYPINNTENEARYNKYKKLAEQEKHVIFGGRLGSYRYYDMDKVIEEALRMVDKEIKIV